MIMTMLRGSMDLSRWLLLLAGLVCFSSCQIVPSSFENKTGSNEGRPRVFSPRMDYDEWTPLGRGDPLKNNPTFDYVPPVLDRVQYWLDSHTTEPSAKRDILVLGVTAKKTSPKIPEQFLKFVDGPKFTRTSNQDTSYRNDFTGSTGAEPPKLVRTTSFRNGIVDYRNQNRIQSIPASYYPSPYYAQKTKPYTMMMPPPLGQKQEPSASFNTAIPKDKVVNFESGQQYSTQTEEGPVLQDSQFYALPPKNYQHHSVPASSAPTRAQVQASSSKTPLKTPVASQIETIKSAYTPPAPQPTKTRFEPTTSVPSVSFEKSNLIYQSTQTLSGGWLGNNGPTSSTTSHAGQVTWQTPDYSRDQYEIDHHVPAASSNHEVVVGQNANIIVDGDNNENEEVVMGQKELVTEAPSTSSPVSIVQASSTWTTKDADKLATDPEEAHKMHIVVANAPATNLDLDQTNQSKNGAVAVVMPTNYDKKPSPQTVPQEQTVFVHPNVTEAATTTEQPSSTPTQQPPKSHPTKHTVTSSPMFIEDPMSPASFPNRQVNPQHQVPHPPSPSRYPPAPPHMFVVPQPAPQPMMHHQSRPNHGTMQFIGSMRPGIGFRPSSSMTMSHVSPPMAHMHAPPMKNMMMGPSLGMNMGVSIEHKRPQMLPFQMPFTNPPAPSTMTLDPLQVDNQHADRHQSRLPDRTILTTMSPTSLPVTPSTTLTPSSSPSVEDYPKVDQSPLQKILSEDEETAKKSTVTSRPTTTISPRTTTVPNLTTDPIFSHYKQPAKPIRGPMYVIIQGHSKVKTYKPTVMKHGALENNEIVETVTERQLSKLEQLIRENTKGGAGSERKKQQQQQLQQQHQQQEERTKSEKRPASQDSLMSLVESGFSGFTVPPYSSVTEDDGQANSVTTIEINGN